MPLDSASIENVSKVTVGVLISTGIVLIIPEGVEHMHDNSLIGIYLLLGFITLFSVDKLTSLFHISSCNVKSYNSLTLPPQSASSNDSFFSASSDRKNVIINGIKSAFTNTTTLGLLIHCLTDGIVMTTSLSTSDNHVDSSGSETSFMIIIAIFLHKLPASFSLTSILLSDGLPQAYIIIHLILFSLSAPVGAILTYFLISAFGSTKNENSGGELLLFSGGAFLFVGFHALMNVSNKGNYSHSSTQNVMDDTFPLHDEDNDGQSVVVNINSERKTQLVNFGLCILGMLIPLSVTFFHEN